MKESQIQTAIINYIKLQYPNVLYCASAGGLRTSIKQGRMMKACGYLRGTPDIGVFEPRGKFHSLFLEVKTLKGRPTKEQLWWRDELNKRGFVSEIVYGFDEAKIILDKYLNNQIK